MAAVDSTTPAARLDLYLAFSPTGTIPVMTSATALRDAAPRLRESLIDVFASEVAIALYGVVVGALMSWVLTEVARRRETKRRAKYLAFRAVISLDGFVESCAGALTEEPHPTDDVDPDTFAPLPVAFAVPEGVDWTAIEDDVAYAMLTLPERDRAARLQLEGLYQHDTSIRALRDRLFTRLALDAAQLADRLRARYSVPPRIEQMYDTSQILREWAEKELSNNRLP